MPDSPNILDYLVPAIGDGYIGNGANNAVDYLLPYARDGDGLTQTEIDNWLAIRPADGPLERAAFRHDIGTINHANGDVLGTGDQIANDFQFAGASLQAFFQNPIANMFGLAMAAFGVLAAGYHAVTGVLRSIGEAISSAFQSLFHPVVLDLDGDGVELVGVDGSTAHFDFDGDGIAEQTGWVGADDGLLVFDADGSGVIDAADEVAFVSYLEGAQTDLEGLSAFDTDGDGYLTEADASGGGFDWSQFKVWQDANQNGISDAGELVSLADAGIVSIGLGLNGEASESEGNIVHNTTTFTRVDGTVGQAADVSFAINTHGAELVTVSDSIVGIATDLGLSAIFIGAEEENLVVTGTSQDDVIVFTEMDDVFLVSGGDGYDTVVFAGEVDIADLEIFKLEGDGLLGVRNTETGETFFVANDVEALSIGAHSLDLTSLWT